LEFARGEWQISRVYAVLNRPQPALHHAQRSLALCEDNGIADFDLAFGYEALARAHAEGGNASSAREYIEKARQAGEAIEDEGNREYFFGELAGVSELVD
jgi:hypothetical protein